MNPRRLPLVAVNKGDPKHVSMKDIADGNVRCSFTNYILTGNPIVPKTKFRNHNESAKAAKKPELPASDTSEGKNPKVELIRGLVGLLESEVAAEHKAEHDSELKIKTSTHRSEGRETSMVSAKITHSPQDPKSDKDTKVANTKPDNKSRRRSVSFDASLPSEDELEPGSTADGDKSKAQGKKSKGKGKELATPDTAPANPPDHAASGGKEWTPSDDAMVLGMKEGGGTWANIGNAVSRSKGEVQKRYKELMASKGDTAKDAATPAGKSKEKVTTEGSTVKDVIRTEPEQSYHSHRPPLEQPKDNHRPPPESFQGFPPPVNHYSHDREYYPPASHSYPPPQAPYGYPPPQAPYGYPYRPDLYHTRPVQYIHPPPVAAVYPTSPYLPPIYEDRHRYDGDVVYHPPHSNTRVNGGGPDIAWYTHDGPAVQKMAVKGVHSTWIRCYTGDEVSVNDKVLREPPNGWRNDRHKNASSSDGKRYVIEIKCNSGEDVWVMATRMDEPFGGWGNYGTGYRYMRVNGESTGVWDRSKSSRPTDGGRGSGSNKPSSVKPASVNRDWGSGSTKSPAVNGGWDGGSKKSASGKGDWGDDGHKTASIKEWINGSTKSASVKGVGWGDDTGSNKGSHRGSNKGSGSVVGFNVGGNSGTNGDDWGDHKGGGGSGAAGDGWGNDTNGGGGGGGGSGDAGDGWGNDGGGGSGDWGNGDTNADNTTGKDDWGDTAKDNKPADGSTNGTGKYSRSDKRGQKSSTGRAPHNNRTNWKSVPKTRKHSKDDDNVSQASWEKPFVVDPGLGPFSDTGSIKNQNWHGVDGTKGSNKDWDQTGSGNTGGTTDWNNPGPSHQPSGGW